MTVNHEVKKVPFRLERSSRYFDIGPLAKCEFESGQLALHRAILAEQRQAADVPVKCKERASGSENRAARRLQGHANKAGAAEDKVRVRLRRDANDAATPAIRSGDVEITIAVKGQPLWTSETAKKRTNFTALRDAVDAVIAGCRRPGDIQVAARMKREMIRGERRFDGCKDKNFAAWTNFEDCSAAISHVEILGTVERYTRGYTHPFNPLLGAAFWRNPMNCAVVAAGDEEISRAVHSQATGIHQRSDEGFYAVVRRNFVERNRNALAAIPRKSDIGIAVRIDRRICNGMQIIRNLHTYGDGIRLAFVRRAQDANHATGRAIGYSRNQPVFTGECQTGFHLAKTHHGSRVRA